MPTAPFNILAVAQAGRLQYEALLLAASLRAADPGFAGRLLLAEPQPTGAWAGHAPAIDSAAVRAALARLEVEVVPLAARAFGAAYPHGNKIEALALLPAGDPFLVLDSDTLVTGALSDLPVAARFAASMKRTDTWPKPPLYGPDRAAIWGALYRMAGLDMAPTLDRRWPQDDWRRYLYFNAGWICGPCPRAFGARYLALAQAIRDAPPPELAAQSLDPWLDQVALPLAIHAAGGGRPGPGLAPLDDGRAAWHWRHLALLYATAPEPVVDTLERVAAPNYLKRALKERPAFHRLIYRGAGRALRARLAAEGPTPPEPALRRRLRREGLWLR